MVNSTSGNGRLRDGPSGPARCGRHLALPLGG
jgi:hypothetical protein